MDNHAGQGIDWERIKLLCEEIQFEHHLMSSRLDSFVTSQSFLFAAFAISGLGEHMHHPAFMWFSHYVVPGIGIVFSLLMFLAVAQGGARLDQLNDRLGERLHRLEGTPMAGVAEDLCLPSLKDRRRSLLYPRWVPVICGVAWVNVGSLSVWYHLLRF